MKVDLDSLPNATKAIVAAWLGPRGTGKNWNGLMGRDDSLTLLFGMTAMLMSTLLVFNARDFGDVLLGLTALTVVTALVSAYFLYRVRGGSSG